VVRCQQCSLESVNPLPSIENLQENYDREMKSDTRKSPYFLEYIHERQTRSRSYDKTYKHRMDLIERLYGRKGNLLDVGCGAGFFMRHAQSRGWNAHGIDILPEYIDYARETLKLQQIHCATLEKHSFAPQYFDAVTLWDLIEHLPHPLDSLKHIHQILKPGGLLTIWTPNTQNGVLLKEQWTGYWPRQHLYFFSRSTLENLLEQAGFRITYCTTTKTKKGLMIPQDSLNFEKRRPPESGPARTWFALKRDLGNFINPMTYLSPLLDRAGFGFNLLVIASRQ